MPKKTHDFPEQINFLAAEGTQARLKAVAYYRGEGGKFASSARDFLDIGYRTFIESLDPKSRKRFEEILSNVNIIGGNLSG